MTDIYKQNLNLYSLVVTICIASLTFSNSAFCQHWIFVV